jgi:hypothetical protein
MPAMDDGIPNRESPIDELLASANIAEFWPNWKLKRPFESVYPSGLELPLQTRSIRIDSGGGEPSSNVTFPDM